MTFYYTHSAFYRNITVCPQLKVSDDLTNLHVGIAMPKFEQLITVQFIWVGRHVPQTCKSNVQCRKWHHTITCNNHCYNLHCSNALSQMSKYSLMQLDEVNIEGRPMWVVVWECACVWPDNHGHCNNPAVLASSFSLPSVFLKARCRPRRGAHNPQRTPQPHGERKVAGREHKHNQWGGADALHGYRRHLSPQEAAAKARWPATITSIWTISLPCQRGDLLIL